MTQLRALVLKELLLLTRDRHALAVLFLMPAAFILIMSLALRDAMDPARSGALSYQWIDEDHGYFALALADALAARPALKRVDAGGAPYTVRIAPGLKDRIAAGDGKTPLIRLELSPTAPAQARLLFVAEVRGALASVQAEYLMEDQMGVPHEDAVKLRAQSDPAKLPVEEAFVGAGASVAQRPTAVQQSVPAWLVFAMFFVVLPLAGSMLIEREQGTLQRLALLNLPAGTLLLAKIPAYYLLNMAQLAIMLAVGVYAVPAIGGDRLALGQSGAGLWLIGSALSLAAIGFGLLISVLAKSAAQATTLGGTANLLFGAIGGVMVPKAVMPPALQAASAISPMSWALEGFWDVLLRNGGVAEVLPEAAALLGFGVLSFTIAVRVFPKTDA